MDRDYSNAHYSTHSVNDRREGYAALELHREIKRESKRVARVVFWGASGEFFIVQPWVSVLGTDTQGPPLLVAFSGVAGTEEKSNLKTRKANRGTD
jgi:hypothetical protein